MADIVKNQVIIQARMGSTRLPGKVLMEVGGDSVLGHVVRRSASASFVNRVVVATSELAQDDLIEQWCKNRGVNCFRGSSEDVLVRYVDALSEFPSERIIRITADCPLVDPGIIDSMIRLHQNNQLDYASNVIKRTFPVGFDTEVVSCDALKRVNKEATEKHHREHVTLYIRDNVEKFKTRNLEFGLRLPELRLTLDRSEDFAAIKTLASYLEGGIKLHSIYKFVQILCDHPEIIEINNSADLEPMTRVLAEYSKKF